MCLARSGRRRARVRHGPRAMARGRRVNSEGRDNRSASDVRGGRAADGVDDRKTVETERPTVQTERPTVQTERPAPPRRPAIPPDDRRTAVIPPVRDDTRPLRDPIDVVKAALDGTPPPPPKQPPPGPPRRPSGGGGGGPS